MIRRDVWMAALGIFQRGLIACWRQFGGPRRNVPDWAADDPEETLRWSACLPGSGRVPLGECVPI